MGGYNRPRKYYEQTMKDEKYLGYRELKIDEVINSHSIEREQVFEKFKLRIVERKYSNLSKINLNDYHSMIP